MKKININGIEYWVDDNLNRWRCDVYPEEMAQQESARVTPHTGSVD